MLFESELSKILNTPHKNKANTITRTVGPANFTWGTWYFAGKECCRPRRKYRSQVSVKVPGTRENPTEDIAVSLYSRNLGRKIYQ